MGLPQVQKTTPTITVVDANDVEMSHTFTKFAHAMQISCNGYEEIRYAWEEGETADGGDYVLVKPTQSKWDDHLLLQEGQKIYLLAPNVASPSTVGVAIEEWH